MSETQPSGGAELEGGGPRAEVARLVMEARGLWEAGRLPESEAPLLRALAIAESEIGPADRRTGLVLDSLGWLAAARGMFEQAVEFGRRALAIEEADLGPDDPFTLEVLGRLADALFEADRHDEADAAIAREIAGHEAAGRDNAWLAGRVGDRGWRLYWVGRYDEAEPLFHRALAMQERHLGPHDPATANSARRLAVMYDHRGFDVDPEPYYRRALAGYEASHSDDHPRVHDARYRLADYLRRSGREFDAAPLFDRIADVIARGGPAGGLDDVHWTLGVLCDYLREQGRDDEAEAIEVRASSYDPILNTYREEAARVEAAHGPGSAELAEALITLGNSAAMAGQADEAEAAIRRAHAIWLALRGPDDPATVEAAGRLEGIRAWAERMAGENTDRRLEGPRETIFDGFTTPWRDERRPDLIRAYLEHLAEPDAGDDTGAGGAVIMLKLVADRDEFWSFLLDVCESASDDDAVLTGLGAGPLEDFLARFDAGAIDLVEAEARRDPIFRRALTATWKNAMSDEVWRRVRAIQATEPRPLAEMRRFQPGDDSHRGVSPS